MKEIAKCCGVSRTAVSQVIHNPEYPRFTEETRKRILAVAKELNYRPNQLSLALTNNRSNLVP